MSDINLHVRAIKTLAGNFTSARLYQMCFRVQVEIFKRLLVLNSLTVWFRFKNFGLVMEIYTLSCSCSIACGMDWYMNIHIMFAYGTKHNWVFVPLSAFFICSCQGPIGNS